MAADGRVTPEAKAAFDAVLARQPGDPRARFYLGLARAQALETTRPPLVTAFTGDMS